MAEVAGEAEGEVRRQVEEDAEAEVVPYLQRSCSSCPDISCEGQSLLYIVFDFVCVRSELT